MASERIVLDASFILEAIIPTTQAGREDAEAIPDGLANGEIKAVVPWIFYCEIAAGCARSVRGRRVSDQTAREFMEQPMAPCAPGRRPTIQCMSCWPSRWICRWLLSIGECAQPRGQ